MKRLALAVALALPFFALAGRKPTPAQEACREAQATCSDTCTLTHGGTKQEPEREKLAECVDQCNALKQTCDAEAKAEARRLRDPVNKPGGISVRIGASTVAGQPAFAVDSGTIDPTSRQSGRSEELKPTLGSKEPSPNDAGSAAPHQK